MISVQPKVYCRRNLTSEDIFQAIPWEVNLPIPTHLRNKEQYTRWCKDGTTDHLFFSLAEGENPSQMIKGENRPHRVFGFIADYDTSGVDSHAFQRMLDNANPLCKPYAWNTTFSGGARVVWLFQAPLLFPDVEIWKRFAIRLRNELKMERLIAGYDKHSESLGRYFTAGGNWTVNPEHPVIKSNALETWLLDSCRADDFSGGVEIPLDVVAAEVEKKYPGAWVGDFKEGARGKRFWDPMADNPSAAIVRPTGMQCFTGDQQFVKWEKILGRPFVQTYLESRLGAAINDMFFDGMRYYRKLGEAGPWDGMNVDTAKRHLKVQYRLNPAVDKDEGESEVERCLHRLETYKRVDGAFPFPHNPETVVSYNGQKYLNVSMAKLWTPAIDPQEWGVNFPWTANFIDNFFADAENKDAFLTWLHHWMKSLHAGKPRQGHALYIVGAPNGGKTLMSRQIIERLVGGSSDATSFITGMNKYNDALFNAPLWRIDDGIAAGDKTTMRVYSATVKAVVANGTLKYEKKYGGAVDLPFHGRLVVTMNDDSTSLDMLPDVDSSMSDKILMLRTSGKKAEVPPEEEKQELWDREMHYFARWILDYRPQAIAEARFGFAAFHDEHVMKEARSMTRGTCALMAIDSWRDKFWENEGNRKDHKDGSWIGSAGALLDGIQAYDASSYRSVGMYGVMTFSKLIHKEVSEGRCDWIEIKAGKRGRTEFKINLISSE